MVASILHSDGRLELDPDLNETARARQTIAVAAVDRGKKHFLGFHVTGAPGDGVQVRIGTDEGENDLYSGRFHPGNHLIVFIPETGPVYLEISKAGGWPAQIDNVRFFSDEPLELPSPWTQTAVPELRFDQSNDIMTVTHRDFVPCDIVRTADDAFSLEFFAHEDGPYLDENLDDDLTLRPGSAEGNSVELDASSDLFSESDLYRHVTIKHDDEWGWAVIRRINSATSATVQVKRAFGGTTAVPAWRLGAWNLAIGFPAAVAYHDGRQIFAGGVTNELRRRIDGSKAPGFNVFTPGAGDDGDAWTRELSTRGAIKHIVSARQLLVFTTDETQALSGDGGSAPVTPKAFRNTNIGRRGVSDATPISLGTVTLFVDRTKRSVIELLYDALVEGYSGPDMLLLAQHLTRASNARGLVEVGYSENPWSQVWAAREDGELLSLTYLREEQITGWSRIAIADGAGKVESVTVLPGATDDEVWAIVRYEVEGAVRRYVERLDFPLLYNAGEEEAFYVDSGLTLDNRIAARLTPAATEGAGIVFTADDNIFDADDVGRFIRYPYAVTDDRGLPVYTLEGFKSHKTAVAEITARVSATRVRATIRAAFPSTEAIAANDWRLTVTRISGLDHLEGATVAVMGDGRQQADRVVAAGAIELADPAALVHIGRPYSWRWTTLALDLGSRQGTSQGKPANVHRIIARTVRSRGIDAGVWGGRTFPHGFTAPADYQSDPLFTGDIDLATGTGWQDGVVLTLGHDGTYPATVVLLVPHGQVGEAI